jgi:hypothetical protein
MSQADESGSSPHHACLVREYYRVLDHRLDSDGSIKYLVEWKPTWVTSEKLIELVDLRVSRSATAPYISTKLTYSSDSDRTRPLMVADYKRSHEIMLDTIRKAKKRRGRVCFLSHQEVRLRSCQSATMMALPTRDQYSFAESDSYLDYSADSESSKKKC